MKAAIEYDPKEAIGLDGALQKLAAESYGSWLLGLTAAGLMAYGVYCLFDAWYRDVSANRFELRPRFRRPEARGYLAVEKRGGPMWWIILIILAVLIVAGIIIVGGRRAREAQLENKREEAGELRRQADQQASAAGQKASLAQEQADQAEKERAQADEMRERANEVDPDKDT